MPDIQEAAAELRRTAFLLGAHDIRPWAYCPQNIQNEWVAVATRAREIFAGKGMPGMAREECARRMYSCYYASKRLPLFPWDQSSEETRRAWLAVADLAAGWGRAEVAEADRENIAHSFFEAMHPNHMWGGWPEYHSAAYAAADFAIATYGPPPERAEATWECKARKYAGPDPQDCDWPVCGCDSHADKVIEALEESGMIIKPSATATTASEPPVNAADAEALGQKLLLQMDHGFACDSADAIALGSAVYALLAAKTQGLRGALEKAAYDIGVVLVHPIDMQPAVMLRKVQEQLFAAKRSATLAPPAAGCEAGDEGQEARKVVRWECEPFDFRQIPAGWEPFANIEDSPHVLCRRASGSGA